MYNKRPKFAQNKDKVTDKQQRNARCPDRFRNVHLYPASGVIIWEGGGNVGMCPCASVRF